MCNIILTQRDRISALRHSVYYLPEDLMIYEGAYI